MFLLGVELFTVAVIGQCLGGALISADLAGTQWRAIFLLNVPIGLLVIVAGLRHLPPDEHRDSRRLDLGGVSALSVALLLVIVPLVVGRGAGWPPWTWACLGLAGPAIVGFLIRRPARTGLRLRAAGRRLRRDRRHDAGRAPRRAAAGGVRGGRRDSRPGRIPGHQASASGRWRQ